MTQICVCMFSTTNSEQPQGGDPSMPLGTAACWERTDDGRFTAETSDSSEVIFEFGEGTGNNRRYGGRETQTHCKLRKQILALQKVSYLQCVSVSACVVTLMYQFNIDKLYYLIQGHVRRLYRNLCNNMHEQLRNHFQNIINDAWLCFKL